jgi:tRNA dimethylallyltransferase
VELVQRLPLAIVSVDSAMVYRGLNIGTAKPSAEILKIAPHRLIDICDPAEAYSAGRFRADAQREIAELHAAGRIPLLVGGTGLYFRALERGLTALPPADAALRRRIAAEARALGWRAMHARLAAVDPARAARIHPNDPQRIQRALEVHELTGRSMSQWFATKPAITDDYTVIKLVIAPADRDWIRRRVAQRFQAMLAAGLVEEVRALRARGDLSPELPSMRLVGYRQVWSYLDGRLDYREMVQHANVATRQLAKRQLTWLRGETEARWFTSADPEITDKVLKFLRENSAIAGGL